MSTWPASKSFNGIESYEAFVRELARNVSAGVSDNNALYNSVRNHPGMMSEEEWTKGKRIWDIISKMR